MGRYENYDPVSQLVSPNTFERWEKKEDNHYDYPSFAPEKTFSISKGDIPWGTAHIYYNLDMVQHEDPEIVTEHTTTVDNSSGGVTDQTTSLTYSKAVSSGSHDDNSHTWANQAGGEVEGDESVGIPFFEKTKIKIKTTYNHTDTHSHTWGTSLSTTETVAINEKVTAGPGEKILGEAILTKVKFAVPYKLWKFEKYPSPKPSQFGVDTVGILHESFGIFRGESSYELHAKFTKIN